MTNMFPFKKHNNMRFSEIYESVNDFVYDYNNIGLPKLVDTPNIMTLYYLLIGRYGNSTIANDDINQFKMKVFSIIWQYGPTWEKRLDIQARLRDLQEDDIIKGAKAIYNHASNPSVEPTTSTLEELEYIDSQNTTNYKKSKLEAYGQLWLLLDNDVTSDFLSKFSSLFVKFVEAPNNNLVYFTEEEDE